MFRPLLVLALLIVIVVRGGHEVLYKHELKPTDVKPQELLIVQFDSRPLSDYWNVSARWNKAYADKYGHKYLFLSSKSSCRFGPHHLADVWCKVKAMVLADKLTGTDPTIKACLFLDSDVAITVNSSMTVVLSYIKQDRKWDTAIKPVALNQDGPGWSCKHTLALGYKQCLNSGTVYWERSQTASDIILEWWMSAGDPYKQTNKFPSKWRTKWPWEQAQLYEVYRRHAAQIMLLTFPDLPHLPWTSKANPKSQYPTDAVEPYCFSHWPGANCFITHYCSSKNQKLKLKTLHDLPHQVIDFDFMYLEDLAL